MLRERHIICYGGIQAKVDGVLYMNLYDPRAINLNVH